MRLDPDATTKFNIILPFGKYSYKRLSMGIAGSLIMSVLEYVQINLDDP